MATDFKRNNLDQSLSPYLRQHANNPIWWQEWTPESLAAAKNAGKNILVSIGYSTCHWCHVMASEAFSDPEIADYLNENYLSIKVDREQRPDIDQYFMAFLTSTTGSGGWPLNVFLSPDTQPIVAFTYLPVDRRYGMMGMLEILEAVKERGRGMEFSPEEVRPNFSNRSTDEMVADLLATADTQHGGFGRGPKFPPCSTLLFLLTYHERYPQQATKEVLQRTLKAIMTRGLHDHVQGGFFRYCVDEEWTLPHFEKMLYDQAMLLWVYSWAYRVFKEQAYLDTIKGLLKCLDETFLDDGLYISAHDADTHHHEGATYLWSMAELEAVLTDIELSELRTKYFISSEGNFEGKIHLVGRDGCKRSELEEKLLTARRNKPQPFADRKIITSWNALAGMGLIMAYRATGMETLLEKATTLFARLIEKHFAKNILAHSSLQGILQEQAFLEDAASLLLFATYLEEERADATSAPSSLSRFSNMMERLKGNVEGFRDADGWIESNHPDFMKVSAPEFDHPAPASSSLADMALLRCRLFSQEEGSTPTLHPQNGREFFNIASFIAEGHWHIIRTPEKIDWNELSINAIQIRSEIYSDCFEGTCSRP